MLTTGTLGGVHPLPADWAWSRTSRKRKQPSMGTAQAVSDIVPRSGEYHHQCIALIRNLAHQTATYNRIRISGFKARRATTLRLSPVPHGCRRIPSSARLDWTAHMRRHFISGNKMNYLEAASRPRPRYQQEIFQLRGKMQHGRTLGGRSCDLCISPLPHSRMVKPDAPNGCV